MVTCIPTRSHDLKSNFAESAAKNWLGQFIDIVRVFIKILPGSTI